VPSGLVGHITVAPFGSGSGSRLNQALLRVVCRKKMFELLSLFPSAEAIKRGDKDYHAAVNIANVMHNRVAHWEQGGW
jgi:hypothetical protein